MLLARHAVVARSRAVREQTVQCTGDKLLLSDVIWRARLNSSEGGLGALRKSGSESGCT
jgi:hypothetical protein